MSGEYWFGVFLFLVGVSAGYSTLNSTFRKDYWLRNHIRNARFDAKREGRDFDEAAVRASFVAKDECGYRSVSNAKGAVIGLIGIVLGPMMMWNGYNAAHLMATLMLFSGIISLVITAVINTRHDGLTRISTVTLVYGVIALVIFLFLAF